MNYPFKNTKEDNLKFSIVFVHTMKVCGDQNLIRSHWLPLYGPKSTKILNDDRLFIIWMNYSFKARLCCIAIQTFPNNILLNHIDIGLFYNPNATKLAGFHRLLVSSSWNTFWAKACLSEGNMCGRTAERDFLFLELWKSGPCWRECIIPL